ncbi:AI-2E family transporter [Roseococcus sp. DSY-14]|uniref:AI-2E family transporter n=1 Tax=Roseococcus sp. DSY-14 TaxID=3369650 RepID=UPI00387B0B82
MRPTPADPLRLAATLFIACVVVTTLYVAKEVLVPLTIGALLAFVLAPLARALRRGGLPWGLAVVLAAVLAFLLLLGIGWALGLQAAALAAELPRLAATLREKFGALSGLGDLLRQAQALVTGEAPAAAAAAPAPAAAAMTPLALAAAIAGPVLHPLATAGLAALFTLFILLFRADLRDRAIRLAGARDLPRTMAAMDDAAERLSRLFLAQVMLAGGFGATVAAGLWLLGLPSPLLWGSLVGLMRFVPFIGTPIAVIPPTLLALAAAPGWELAASVFALIMVGELLMGQVVEPLVFGRRTGLSPISVILSASFWTMLWGPIGLLIATPLTVGLVVLGRHVPQLEFLDVLLGDRQPLSPPERFYQRAMEGDADFLLAEAREEPDLAAHADAVALPALALATADWGREALEAERMDAIRGAAGTWLDALAEEAEPPARPDAWGAPGAVLCIPARGPLDGEAARLAALALRRDGFGAEAAAAGALDASAIGALDPARVRLVCLSVLEEGNSVAGVRTALRRLARALPEARVVVGVWQAAPDSAMLGALREEGAAGALVTTLGEARAQAGAYAASGTSTQRA